jgi:non-lysosomal glucosylceramidase
VAGHMIYEGMIEDGLAITKGARDRYNGVARPPMGRNPWNEIECGGHYARAMSNWSILTGASGFEYDGPAKKLRFTPRVTPELFKSFFVATEGWGSLQQIREKGKQENALQVVEGQLPVSEITLNPPAGLKNVEVAVVLDKTGTKTPVEATLESKSDEVVVKLAKPLVVKSGETLAIFFS